MVQARPCWEGNTGIEARRLNQTPVASLDLIADVHDLHARLDEILGEASCLSMHLSALSQIVVVWLKKLLLGL
jgi:hypothetical protein